MRREMVVCLRNRGGHSFGGEDDEGMVHVETEACHHDDARDAVDAHHQLEGEETHDSGREDGRSPRSLSRKRHGQFIRAHDTYLILSRAIFSMTDHDSPWVLMGDRRPSTLF